MQTRYVICYDISDTRRLRKVHRTMKGYGTPLQYSVFQCDLSHQGRFELLHELAEIIHHEEDRVIIIDAGPVTGRGAKVVEFIGKDRPPPEPGPAFLF